MVSWRQISRLSLVRRLEMVPGTAVWTIAVAELQVCRNQSHPLLQSTDQGCDCNLLLMTWHKIFNWDGLGNSTREVTVARVLGKDLYVLVNRLSWNPYHCDLVVVSSQASYAFGYGYCCCDYAFDVVLGKPLRFISEFLYPFWLHSCKFLPSMLPSLSLSFSACVAQLDRMKTSRIINVYSFRCYLYFVNMQSG